MKIRVCELKKLLRESARMRFTDLMDLQDHLDDALVAGQLSQREYERQWDEILAAAGYTPSEYASEIDRRWDYVDSTRGAVVEPLNRELN